MAGRFVRRVLTSRRLGAVALLAAWSMVIATATAGRPPDGRWIGLPSLGAVAVVVFVASLVAVAALIVVGLLGPRTRRTGPPVRRSRWSTLVLLAVIVAFALVGPRPKPEPDRTDPDPVEAGDDDAVPGRRIAPNSAELALLAVLAAATAAVVASSRRSPGPAPPTAADREPDVLPAVDDARRLLRLGDGPRHAVLAAYAALESGFTAAGLPRRPSETPSEYTTRVLEGHPVDAVAVTELARLYERARYSTRPVTADDRHRALAALDRAWVSVP